MDARYVAGAAGVGVNTLNTWIARGYVPGMALGSRGLRRDFDFEMLAHVLIVTQLVRLGFDASFASAIAERRRKSSKRLLLSERNDQAEPNSEGKIVLQRGAPVVAGVKEFNSEKDLPKVLAEIGHPGAYLVVDIDALTARARQDWKQWQRQQVKAPAA